MAKQAIEGSRLNAFGVDADDLVIVGYDTKDGPEHPLWDGDRLPSVIASITEEWIRNLTSYGVLEPVLVRKNGERVEVVAGRRRVLGARAASTRLKEAGSPPLLVPCMVKRTSDTDATGMVIAENEGRLNDAPIVRAKKLARLLARGYSETSAAIAMCIPLEEVTRLLPLLDLDDRVQQMLEDRQLGQTVALTLRDLPREEQVAKAEAYVASGVTVEEARRQTKLRKNGANGANGHEKKEAPVRSSRPSTVLLRKLADDKEFMEGLKGADARDLLLWILGEEGRARRIAGLTARLASTKTSSLLVAHEEE